MRTIAANCTEHFANTWEFSALCETFFALLLIYMNYTMHVVLNKSMMHEIYNLNPFIWVHILSLLSNNYSIVTRESTMHQRASSVADIVQNVFVLNGDYFCSKSNLINHLKECTTNEGCVCCELISRHSYSLSLNRAFIVTISLQMLRLHFKIHSISNAWTLCISCL